MASVDESWHTSRDSDIAIYSCLGSKVELSFSLHTKPCLVPRIHLLNKLESCEATFLIKDEVMGSKA